MMSRPRVIAAVLATLLLAMALAGCGDGGTVSDVAVEDPETGVEDSAVSASADTAPYVLVLGRSVMTDWMAHWGGDASTPALFAGHEMHFREVEGPPGIADSAAAAIAEAPEGSTVLFKYCFVDFNGGDHTGEIDAYLRDVARVADAARTRDVRLILGTALPKVRGETTPELVAEHREFGRLLEEFAAGRRAAGQDVVVLDLNALLADDDGSLARRYAVSAGDSHLSLAAYETLDDALEPLLAERP